MEYGDAISWQNLKPFELAFQKYGEAENINKNTTMVENLSYFMEPLPLGLLMTTI